MSDKCSGHHCPHCGKEIENPVFPSWPFQTWPVDVRPIWIVPPDPYVPTLNPWPGYPAPYVGDWPIGGTVTVTSGGDYTFSTDCPMPTHRTVGACSASGSISVRVIPQ